MQITLIKYNILKNKLIAFCEIIVIVYNTSSLKLKLKFFTIDKPQLDRESIYLTTLIFYKYLKFIAKLQKTKFKQF